MTHTLKHLKFFAMTLALLLLAQSAHAQVAVRPLATRAIRTLAPEAEIPMSSGSKEALVEAMDSLASRTPMQAGAALLPQAGSSAAERLHLPTESLRNRLQRQRYAEKASADAKEHVAAILELTRGTTATLQPDGAKVEPSTYGETSSMAKDVVDMCVSDSERVRNAASSRIQKRIARFASSKYKSGLENDVANGAIERLWKKCEEFALGRIKHENIDAYVFAVAKNLIRSEFRKQYSKPTEHIKSRYEDHEYAAFDDYMSGSKEKENIEISALMKKYITKTLPPGQATVFFLEAMDYKRSEIAEMLGVGYDTIKERSQKARSKIDIIAKD